MLSKIILLLFIACYADSVSKYSKELNEEKSFRMLKLNLIFEKASNILTGQKLKNLKNDLKQQDKDEITLKRLKADGQDKDGIREAEVRRRLKNILQKYGIDSKVDDISGEPLHPEDKIEKQIFKDKKLNKLWNKAEQSGFSEEELMILKEEFQHHQEKLDDYNQHIKTSELTREEINNHILVEDPKLASSSSGRQSLDEKHRDVKRSFDSLKVKVRKGPKTELEEKEVKNLWDLAVKSDFTPEELQSLKEELIHFQTRIRKLKFFQTQLESENLLGKDTLNQKSETHGKSSLRSKVEDLDYKVNKLHKELETRIMRRHIEL